MEAKKTKRADMQNRRVLFMEIGLVVALAAVVGAFAVGQSEKKVEILVDQTAVVEEEQIINTEQTQKPPEIKVQPIQAVSDFIDVVRDDTKITTDYDFSEFSEDIVVAPPVVVVEEIVEDIPMHAAEEMPSFQGGDVGVFRQWVYNQLDYPRMAQENSISGTVNIKFVIERDGSLSNIEEISSPDRILTDEVVRILKLSPKWTPGKHLNKPVRVFYILPIKFELKNI